MTDLPKALDVLYRLGVGVVGVGDLRHERPHKPAMVLAALDAISAGVATPGRIEWSTRLRDRFKGYFDIVHSANDSCTPENPFYYLRSDGFWEPMRVGPAGTLPLEAPPKAGDADSGNVYASFIPEWTLLVADNVARSSMREAIVARYFPWCRERLKSLIGEDEMAEPEISPAAGRSAAFRRQVLEVYDFQCCACGLRILIPEREITFVDAAHIVPFAMSRNDHPTNGMALCKNHHWAMDQGLISPDTTRVWRVSLDLDPRRSKGEEELAGLGGRRMLLPSEPAYAPDTRALEWRHSRLKTG